ncbi:MAG: DUF1080 domain-containing protein [Gimesia sp.]|nr:DUF1080 domain-containing protein [Gimesia sp.]
MAGKKSSKGFDPYHRWFGIAKENRPPTYYELLGIAPEEMSPQIIEAAAERQADFVQQFEAGEHAETAHKIQYEIQEAKFCLLDSQLRIEYDKRLRKRKKKGSNTHRKKGGGTPGFSSSGSPVGEGTGFVSQYLGLVSILLVAFLVMAAASFLLPWQKVMFDKQAENEKGAPAIPAVPVVPEKIVNQNVPKAANPKQPQADKAKVQTKWITLFNGKDLTGWTVAGDLKWWKIQNGELYTTRGKTKRGPAECLVTNQEFADFELELEYKLSPGANSGIMIRKPARTKTKPIIDSMEIQLLDDALPRFSKLKSIHKSGAVYGVIPPNQQVSTPAGQWHKMKVRADGRRLVVTVNQTKIIDANIDDYVAKHLEKPELKHARGVIGLQKHNAGVVRFRNIRIREI